MKYLREIVTMNRGGDAVAIPSVCSAHPEVLKASLLLAAGHGRPLLVEATSNQVNQFGGYTGMRPSDFVRFVYTLCDGLDLPRDMVLLGGDHLGPQVWKECDAETAMANASELVREYVCAGFTKIHLDCSEGCAGEPAQVSDTVSAGRAATLAKICEQSAPDPPALSYVVGTEVPPPGGARADESVGVVTTRPDAAIATIEEHQKKFAQQGLKDAWGRVVGLVVQPGLEFGPDYIDHFPLGGADDLSTALRDYPNLSFEAHSTDYQLSEVYPELARRHFAVLKIGPALTFAYREAIYALDHIAKWMTKNNKYGSVVETMDQLMLANSGPWHDHYQGQPSRVSLMRHFGYSDRIRYYWNCEEANEAVAILHRRLANEILPEPLVRQYFCDTVLDRSDRLLSGGHGPVDALIFASVQSALEPYFFDI